MKSLWNDEEAKLCKSDLDLRVYTSRLLGREADLVLHGGGNTSVKSTAIDLFGQQEEIIYIKGSGWDLATIEAAGFAPVRLQPLKKMAELEVLSDTDMVRWQRAFMIDPNAPTPSVEAILHASIPFKFVDHTHADAIATLTNSPKGCLRIQELFGASMLVVPYVMPGFVLAKKVFELTRDCDWKSLKGLILMNHGAFTFGDSARESYEKMIEVVNSAEGLINRYASAKDPASRQSSPPGTKIDTVALARIRREVSLKRKGAVIAKASSGGLPARIAMRSDLKRVSQYGPLTPDHIIRTKRTPMLLDKPAAEAVADYASEYQAYFNRLNIGGLSCLNSAPCWAIWPGVGTIAFGATAGEAQIIQDISEHTLKAYTWAEAIDGYQGLGERDLFEVEYWELEQAKLKKASSKPAFQGKIALVTGAASGIGKACVETLAAQGAVVAALDINPAVTSIFNKSKVRGIVCDVTKAEALHQAVVETVEAFGGLDILVSNAGIFPESATLGQMRAETWDKSININLTSHQRLLQACLPYLSLGIDPAIVIVASKNVPAPGPGAGAYSVAKAGLTQMARVAALELAGQGIRVNVIHPNMVFDTALWTPEILEKRAAHYKMSVEDYKTNNLLRTEVTSKDVADLVCALAGPAFSKITGAQIPIDGGNERVI